METRATVTIREGDRNSTLLCKLYVHYDGYPSGLGADLARLMAGKKIVSGIAYGSDISKQYNGMSCFAASVVSVLKTGPGNVYLVSAEHGSEEYDYVINSFNDITVWSWGEQIFSGNAEELKAFCELYDMEDDSNEN